MPAGSCARDLLCADGLANDHLGSITLTDDTLTRESRTR
jgi:hypothetical protein